MPIGMDTQHEFQSTSLIGDGRILQPGVELVSGRNITRRRARTNTRRHSATWGVALA